MRTLQSNGSCCSNAAHRNLQFCCTPGCTKAPVHRSQWLQEGAECFALFAPQPMHHATMPTQSHHVSEMACQAARSRAACLQPVLPLWLCSVTCSDAQREARCSNGVKYLSESKLTISSSKSSRWLGRHTGLPVSSNCWPLHGTRP